MSSSTNNDLLSQQDNSSQAPADVAIIEPPPDCRRMLEKTARLVSERGLEMESRVMECNKNDRRFSFLKSSDPYHPFYQQKLTVYFDSLRLGIKMK